MYMYVFSVCRVSVLSRRSWNVLCWGNHLSAVFADMLQQERIGITASFENVSERNNTIYVLITNDETQKNISDEVSVLTVPGTHFDRQPHTHHNHQN